MIKKIAALLLFLCPLFAEAEKEETETIKTSDQHFVEGLGYFAAQDFEKALHSFDLAELETKDLYRLQFNQGLCHMAMGEAEKTEELFKKVLGSQEPGMQMKAHYNLGHLYFAQSIKSSGNAQTQNEYNVAKLEEASFAFRDVLSLARRYEGKLGSESLDIVNKAEKNIEIIAAKYIHYQDQLAKSKGRKTKVIQGKVQVNGRPAPHAFVYLKSKWEDSIYAHTRSDAEGGFKFEGLEVGKYQLATLLYEEDKAENLKWGEDIKLPAFETDNHDLKIQGAMTLAMPYQSQSPSLETPWDDHLRFQGSQSIVSSTDWGELTDGRPVETLPENNDMHRGYVSFNVPNLRLAMAMPTIQEQPAAPGQNVEQSTEPAKPPTYEVTLKGFHNAKDVNFPKSMTVFGMKEGKEEPMQLYNAIIKTTESGRIEWKSEPFVHQDCRQLIFQFDNNFGKRMSFHEIEVYEDKHQENQDQQQNQDQNQDPNQQQDQDQEQDPQQNQDQEQPQQPEERESRSVRNILQQVKKKNEEAKERQKVDGVILHTDKDY